jgi:hypothetical protein
MNTNYPRKESFAQLRFRGVCSYEGILSGYMNHMVHSISPDPLVSLPLLASTLLEQSSHGLV